MLIFHYIKIYIKILIACLKTFGFGTFFLYYLYKIPLKIVYFRFFLFLDNVFFYRFRRIKIENPIFIVGHPRSATTFFHEILRQTDDFLVYQKWDLIHPALTERWILPHSSIFRIFHSFFISELRLTPHRIKTLLKSKTSSKGLAQKQNRKFETIAKEEELLFLHTLDTQFLAMETPLGFDENGYPEICFNDEQPHQEKSVLFFKNCLKRQIYITGKKQIIAKMNFSLFRVKTLLKIFPDAKFIYIARSPLETIPSHLSLH
ncbi:MAG: sulfotransferase, partial [Deltaproteobacteria bacterium]